MESIIYFKSIEFNESPEVPKPEVKVEVKSKHGRVKGNKNNKFKYALYKRDPIENSDWELFSVYKTYDEIANILKLKYHTVVLIANNKTKIYNKYLKISKF